MTAVSKARYIVEHATRGALNDDGLNRRIQVLLRTSPGHDTSFLSTYSFEFDDYGKVLTDDVDNDGNPDTPVTPNGTELLQLVKDFESTANTFDLGPFGDFDPSPLTPWCATPPGYDPATQTRRGWHVGFAIYGESGFLLPWPPGAPNYNEFGMVIQHWDVAGGFEYLPEPPE